MLLPWCDCCLSRRTSHRPGIMNSPAPLPWTYHHPLVEDDTWLSSALVILQPPPCFDCHTPAHTRTRHIHGGILRNFDLGARKNYCSNHGSRGRTLRAWRLGLTSWVAYWPVRLLLCALLSPERHGEQQYGAIKLKGTIKKNLALRARPHFLSQQALEEPGL